MSARRLVVAAARLVIVAGALLAPVLPAQELAGTSVHDRVAAVERDLDLDHWAAARVAARRLVADRPDDARARILLGRAEFRAGRLDEAARLLEATLGAGDEPFDARGAMTLARLRVARGQAPGDLVARALAAAANDPVVLFWAADLAASRDAARDALRRYLAVGDRREERVESARGTLALLERLGERVVWRPTERPDELRLPLRPIAAGGGRVAGIVVDSAFGPRNRRVRLLLDSGSGGLFVVERKLRRSGFEPLAAGTTFGGGGDGRHASRRGTVPTLELGGLRFEDALATESTTELSARGEFHGILGLAPFAGYRLRIDVGRRVLIATRVDAAAEQPREAPEPDGGVSWAPYWILSGQMLVEATAAGNPGLFLFDTGASRSVLDTSFVDTLPAARVTTSADVRGYGGRVEGARVLHDVRVEFQGRGAGDDGLRAIDLGVRGRIVGVELAGYLGLDVLAGGVIEIDTARRRVRLLERD